jgi:hypothetical protein
MNRILFVLVLALSSAALAQDATPAPSSSAGLTPDQVQFIRENLKGISDVMGVQQGTGNKGQNAAPTDQKSMADVADKALNLMSGLVVKVAGTLEKIAPKFWMIMVRQQYAKALADTIVPCSLAAFFLVIWVLLKQRLGWPDIEKEHWRDEDWAKLWLGVVIPGLAFLITFWVSMSSVSSAAKYVINPEYYAVRDILMMFTQPGSL